jgi:hypothetical protein
MPISFAQCPACKRPVPIEYKDVYRTMRDEKTQFDTRCVCGEQVFGWLESAPSDLVNATLIVPV